MLHKFKYIGYIAKTHGLYGLCSIKLEGSKEFCELCSQITEIYVDNNCFSVKNSQLNTKIFLKTKLREISNREDAKLLLRKSVYIKPEDFPTIDKLIKKENQVINFQVIDMNNNIIGVIESINYNRPQPIMRIKKDGKEILAPYVNNFILKIDISAKKVFVDFPEGLIEICSI